MKPITLIELPFNLGLKEPIPGVEPGVRRLPEWLRQHNFHNLVSPEKILFLPAPPYHMVLDHASGVLNANAIVAYAQEQALMLQKVLADQEFPLLIGGDCSIMIGSALALKQRGRYALFYLDGHTDFMEPPMSQTKAAGGMAAAMVCGHGPEKLTNIHGMGPYIEEEFVWCVGNREYDEAYERVVRHSGATYLSLASLREKGIQASAKAFLEKVVRHRLDGFWLHIDADVLDDALMPAVDSRTPGGLSYAEFDKLISLLLESPKAVGLELTILDPDLDPTGEYTTAFVDHFASTINKAFKNKPEKCLK